jgi:hypothetical protein
MKDEIDESNTASNYQTNSASNFEENKTYYEAIKISKSVLKFKRIK